MEENKNITEGLSPKGSNNKEAIYAIVIVVAFITIFALGNLTGRMVKTKDDTVTQDSAQTTLQSENTTASAVADPTETAQPTAEKPTDAPTVSSDAPSSAPTVAPTAELTVPDSQKDASSMSKAEIIELFNTAANKIKPNATKITLNYKKQEHLSEYTELPSAIQSVGSGLISTFLKDANDPEVWDSKEVINEKFPKQNETWSGKVTEADVTEVSCTDDGTSYNITLKFIESTDPKGVGVDNAFNTLSSEDVMSATPIVTGFSVRYFDGVINCKIDKATGKITWINYHNPMVLSAEAKVIVAVSGTVGMMFEEDYTIEY